MAITDRKLFDADENLNESAHTGFLVGTAIGARNVLNYPRHHPCPDGEVDLIRLQISQGRI
jgi:hypothetical protein